MKNRLSKEELFKRAEMGDVSILSDPYVSKYRDHFNQTPLHTLADKGCIEVLNHKDVDRVLSKNKYTPLHMLATEKKLEILKNKNVDKLKNIWNDTAFDILCESVTYQYTRNYLKYIMKLLQRKNEKQ